MSETPFYDSLLHDLVGFPARSLVGSRPGHRVTWMGVDITVSAVGPDDAWVEVTCAYAQQSWTKRLDTTAPAEVLTEVMPAEVFTVAPIELVTVEPATPDTAPDVYAEQASNVPEVGGVADGPPA